MTTGSRHVQASERRSTEPVSGPEPSGSTNGANTGPALSVVIPVFNEAPCLDPFWERLRAALEPIGLSWEVLFVDDGSTDDSPAILAALRCMEPRVRVLTLARNSGQTGALLAGFGAARGEWVVTLDADLQNPPEEIARLLDAASGVDLVFGRRARRHDSWLRRVSSRIGNRTRDLITGHRVADTGCSLKLFRTESLRRIPIFNGMHRFLPTLFVFHGFAVKEIEVAHEHRVAGTSKYGIGNRIWRGLADCFAVRWMRSRILNIDVTEEP